jgi:hypothetical protein
VADTPSLRAVIRRFWLLLTIVLLIPLALAASLVIRAIVEPPLSVGPRLELDNSCPLYLGVGEVGQVLTGEFLLRNKGCEPLNFQLIPGCGGCSKLEPREGEIPPGRQRQIKVGVKLNNEGRGQSVLIRVFTNDPLHLQAEYHVVTKCRVPLVISPKSIDFGRVTVSKLSKIPPTRLQIFDSEGRPIRAEAGISIRSNNPLVTVVKDENSDDTLTMKVAIDPRSPSGMHVAQIDIRLTGADRGVEIPVRAEIEGLVRVSPETVYLRMDPSTAQFRDATFFVTSTDDSPLGEVRINATSGFVVHELAPTSAKRRRFSVRRESGKTLESGVINLSFQALDGLIVAVPVYAD